MSSPEVESKDRQILSLLAADGRMSFTDLGKATDLSTSAVHQRVKRLEQRGLIKGYGATVDHDCMLGRGVHVCPGVNLAGGAWYARARSRGHPLARCRRRSPVRAPRLPDL